MTTTDKLREAHAHLGNAIQALRDALGSAGCSELLADCVLDQIAPAHSLKTKVSRLYELAKRTEDNGEPK